MLIDIGHNRGDGQIFLGQQGEELGHHLLFLLGKKTIVTNKNSKGEPDDYTNYKRGAFAQLPASFFNLTLPLYSNVFGEKKLFANRW
jgi:hypothetical protein